MGWQALPQALCLTPRRSNGSALRKCRGRSYGELLLKKAEGDAVAAHMKRSLLNPYSFQAPAVQE